MSLNIHSTYTCWRIIISACNIDIVPHALTVAYKIKTVMKHSILCCNSLLCELHNGLVSLKPAKC